MEDHQCYPVADRRIKVPVFMLSGQEKQISFGGRSLRIRRDIQGVILI